jgi:hypothetical protein
LVDEATDFQAKRKSDALALILEAFVQKELRKWLHTFPSEFYEQLYRLRGIQYPPKNAKPQYIGILTNNIVYDRLAPKVREELKRPEPRDASGRHKDKLHQRLTADIGHPRLREHLTAVIALMRVSPDHDVFEMLLNAAGPRWDDTLSLPLDTISVLPRLNARQRVPRVATGEADS